MQADSLPTEPPRKLKNTKVGSLLLQQIFPTQELNRGLMHCRQIFFYQLSHKGSPRILERVAYPFFPSSADLPNPGIEPPALQVDSLPAEPPRKARVSWVAGFSVTGFLSRSCCPLVACRVSAGQSRHSLKRGGGAAIPL